MGNIVPISKEVKTGVLERGEVFIQQIADAYIDLARYTIETSGEEYAEKPTEAAIYPLFNDLSALMNLYATTIGRLRQRRDAGEKI